MGSIFVNNYVFNLYGILEGLISNQKMCLSRSLNHYAMDYCQDHPLSLQPVYVQVLKVHRQLDQVIAKSIAYVGMLFGVNLGVQDLLYESFLSFAMEPLSKSSILLNKLKVGGDTAYVQKIAQSFKSLSESGSAGVAALVGGFMQAVFGSIHGMIFLYNEIFLKYVLSLVQNQNYKDFNDVSVAFFALSNVVYDSIVSGKMHTYLIAPQFRMCQTFSRLTGDSESATGKVIFHSCASMAEIFYASMHVMSATVTLAGVSDCICNINDNEREFVDVFEKRCRHKLPISLHAELTEYIQTRNRQNSISLCETIVNSFKNVLLKIPNRAKIHIDIALQEAINVPVQVMNFLKIQGLEADSCTQYSTTLDVITIIPRPISAFKKCAYIPSCRSVFLKCFLCLQA